MGDRLAVSAIDKIDRIVAIFLGDSGGIVGIIIVVNALKIAVCTINGEGCYKLLVIVHAFQVCGVIFLLFLQMLATLGLPAVYFFMNGGLDRIINFIAILFYNIKSFKGLNFLGNITHSRGCFCKV